MNTGADDYRKLGAIRKWNYEPQIDFYDSECDTVKGSGGAFFPPERDRHDPLELFTGELCRSIPLEYKEDVEIHGITGYKYYGGLQALDNGTLNPQNECYCNGDCVPSGVMNVTACSYGCPFFMSFPHFHNADPYYLSMVDGISPPDPEKHEFSFTIEPETGAPIAVNSKFQANLLVKPIEHVSIFEDVPQLFMPLIWFEQKFYIDEKSASDLKIGLRLPLIGQLFSCVIALIGVIMIIIVAYNQCFQKAKDIEMMEKSGAPIESKPEGSPLLYKKSTPICVKIDNNNKIKD